MEAQDIETLKGQLNYHVIIFKKRKRDSMVQRLQPRQSEELSVLPANLCLNDDEALSKYSRRRPLCI
jgi:hypothetical protein